MDAVTWTPLSRQRRRERGYDQAQLLAKWVARELELPVLGMLDKVRDIPPQSGIQDDARRRANVLGAYRLRKDARPEGMNLLLVDDVVTSGSTLSECARLLSAQARRRWYAPPWLRQGKIESQNGRKFLEIWRNTS